jgi:DNA-binding response OmpR family regulator
MALLQKSGDVVSERIASCSIAAGPLRLDYHEHVCIHEGRSEVIELTRMEFKLLELLMRNADKPVARDVILSSVWNIHHDIRTNRLEVLINYLRRNLGAELISSVRCWGYRFNTGREN